MCPTSWIARMAAPKRNYLIERRREFWLLDWFLRYSSSIVRVVSMQKRRCRNARCDGLAGSNTLPVPPQAIPADIWTGEDGGGTMSSVFFGPHHPEGHRGPPSSWPTTGVFYCRKATRP